MLSLRRALSYSVASQYTIQIVGLASVMALSRLLTPAEIGVFAVASVVLFLAGEIRTFGIGQYVIREPELDDDKLRKALGVMIITSWGMAGVVAVAAPALGDFYGEPGLVDILWLVAVTFVLSPFIAVPYAMLRRRMAFDTTLRLDVVRTTTQAAVAVGGAYIGLSYMSMAWALAISSAVELVFVQFVKPVGTPVVPKFRGLGEVLRFGSLTGLSGLFVKLGEGTPELVLGRVGSMADVAMFSRGLGLVMIFNRAVTLAVRPVILPHFAAEYRETRSVNYAYLRSVEMQTGLAWPFFATLYMCALPLVRVLYGDQWDESVPAAKILVAWGVLFATFCYCQDALLAAGKVGLAFARELVTFVARVVAILAGARHGPVGVAVAFSAVGVLEFIVTLVVVRRGLGLHVGELLLACRRSALVGGLTVGVCHLAGPSVRSAVASDFATVLAFGTIALVAWCAGLWLFRHPLGSEIVRFARLILQRRAGTDA